MLCYQEDPMPTKKATPKKKAAPKKAVAKKVSAEFKALVSADGKETEIAFTSAAARDHAVARLSRAAGMKFQGMQHMVKTADGEFRYCDVSQVTVL